jgi:hypothetical protein
LVAIRGVGDGVTVGTTILDTPVMFLNPNAAGRRRPATGTPIGVAIDAAGVRTHTPGRRRRRRRYGGLGLRRGGLVARPGLARRALHDAAGRLVGGVAALPGRPVLRQRAGGGARQQQNRKTEEPGFHRSLPGRSIAAATLYAPLVSPGG